MSTQACKQIKALAGVLSLAEPGILAEAVEVARHSYVPNYAQIRAIILLARACGHEWSARAWTRETFDTSMYPGPRPEEYILSSIFYDQERWDGDAAGLWAHAQNDVFVDILNEEGYQAANSRADGVLNRDWPRSQGLDFATLHYPKTAEATVEVGDNLYDFPMQGQIFANGSFHIYIRGAEMFVPEDPASGWIIRALDDDPMTVVVQIDDGPMMVPPEPEEHAALLDAFTAAGFTVKEGA